MLKWRETIFLIVLVVVICTVNSKYVPIFERDDLESERWLNPSSRQQYQRTLLDRMLRTMDPLADPCEDFYQFACGNYESILPKNQSTIFNPLREVTEETERIVKRYIQSTTSSQWRTGLDRKVRDFYQSCISLPSNALEAGDYARRFGDWPAYNPYWSERSFDWMKSALEMLGIGVPVFFKVDTYTRSKDVTKYENVSLGISIADSSYAEPMATREDYAQQLKAALGDSIQDYYFNDMIARVYAFESQIHQLVTDAKIREDAGEYYLHELGRKIRSCDLARFYSLATGKEYDASQTILFESVEFVENVCHLAETTDKRTIADLFFVASVRSYVNLVKLFAPLSQDELQPLCINLAKAFITPIITGMFAKDYFPEESRQEMLNLTKSIQQIGVEMMESQTSWLDASTRRKAAKKMEVAAYRIAFPDYMASEEELAKIYSKLDIDPTNFMRNREQLRKIQFLQKNAIAGNKESLSFYDPLEMSPNFSPKGTGRLTVQLAALMPPIYHRYAPSFWKFGSIMSVIGHEFMHNFDVDLIVFDENGNKSEWMTPNRKLSYEFRSECFYSQFESFKLDNTDVHVKGALTLAENVVDTDGLKMAFKLYQRWMADHPETVWQEEFSFTPLQLTHEQAFFVSYAHTWCDSRKFKDLVEQVATDEHSPGKFRVVGGVSNSPDFARAFKCSAHSKMNPPQKCNYMFD